MALRHPIPPGTRDVLVDERRELRAIESALLACFETHGYGEVQTPAIEYHEVLAAGDERGAPAAYRFFDEAGELLSLRTDMTVPIARLVGTRLAAAEPPFRLAYIGSAYRAVRPQRGQMREFVQAGVELIGPPGPAGTVEITAVLDAALDAVGLERAVIGIGDARLYGEVLAELGIEPELRDAALARLAAHDLVGLEADLRGVELAAEDRETLVRLPALRGGPEVLSEARRLGGAAVEGALARLTAVIEGLAERGVGERVVLDLGMLRELGYYTGAILEVYDPALGHVLGGGGRYDDLTARFGRPLPAAGFALFVERLHIARTEAERLGSASAEPGS